ncbi:MAG TPA: hypothetical protein VM735_06840 [Candidatus Kapabacteria bacterium]|nr:hypothetical protein [Candidatus Kapabacteria bacterium]
MIDKSRKVKDSRLRRRCILNPALQAFGRTRMTSPAVIVADARAVP